MKREKCIMLNVGDNIRVLQQSPASSIEMTITSVTKILASIP